ncbi:MAG: gliding motility-associated C-terminal domain-containing protein [Sphingobacteriaceae bacterium]|nr:gliding motility-associated C-terminal domain-containing protein [Sphingobacteriaceae bacterium]
MYLKATSNGTLTWISGEGVLCASCPNTQIMAKKSGCYLAETVNSFGCKSRDEVCVEVTTDYNIYIPNVFTPNGDGNNDVFLVYGTGITKLEMTIFDRWGEKLFNSKDQLLGWDGMYKGVLSKQDAYTYMVTYTSLDGKKHEKTGHVTLLK